MLIGFTVVFSSCKKNFPYNPNEGGSGRAHVYVAGYEGILGEATNAKYWIDSTEKPLPSLTNVAKASSIFVSADATYIAGYDGGGVFWKDGVETNLTPNGNANSIFVSGSNLLIAGSDNNRAAYWNNGIETALDSFSSGNSIFVSGNDVYVAGTKAGGNAVYWKNGVITILATYSPAANLVTVNSIAVSNGNVHVVGSNYSAGGLFPMIKYWENGVEVRLNFGTDYDSLDNDYGVGNSVFVSGNDIYIAGIVFTSTSLRINNAVYWKNGQEIVLPRSATNSYASSIYVSGNDVYVAGYEFNTGQPKYAVYWKNGVEVKLTDGAIDAYATSIFVK